MTYLIFIIKSSLDDFRRNKIRTALTSLGILIGILSVVLLIAVGLGLKNYIQGQFDSLGTNQIIIFPGKVLQGGGFRPGGGSLGGAKFDLRDEASLKKIKQLSHVAPAFIKTVEVSVRGKSELGDLFASNEDVFTVYSVKISHGRAWTDSDLRKRAKVAVVGPSLVEKFYPQVNPIGKIIKVEDSQFKIVGVAESKGGGGFGGPDLDSFIYIPHTAALSFNPDKTFIAIYAKAKTEDDIPLAKMNIERVLTEKYDEGDFSVLEQSDILNVVTQIFSVLNSVLVAIGAISLIVGGIGIMNIMYVSVVERTREIGIRRAVGATKRDIMAQFLAESILLSLTGGIGAIIIATLLILLVRQVFPASLDLLTIIIAFGVSSFIGIVFGIFPARKAANLTPVDAIRYE